MPYKTGSRALCHEGIQSLEGPKMSVAGVTQRSLLHTSRPLRRTPLNWAFAAAYACAILLLLYHHTQKLRHSPSFLALTLLISDVILAFMWVTTQSFRMRPIHREEFPENLEDLTKKEGSFPALDVFICTADPYKEPPINVVNAALSVMAYEYPTEKLSVYVSDDGGSQVTLYAVMEAAKFARHWLPFCRKKKILDRNPEAFFRANDRWCDETEKLKVMYENMKFKVEDVLEAGKVGEEYISGDHERHAFNKWVEGFTRHDHPTVIQVLLESDRDSDISGQSMGNLIYISREKRRGSPHNFKAGALNALLRVSATMTNAPIILTLDCDVYSNDPRTPQRVLCYVLDPEVNSKMAYIQFPQRFQGLHKNDMYAGEFKRLFHINALGLDGLAGPNYVGTGCFFQRRALFGPPSCLVSPEIRELGPAHIVDKPIQSQSILALAHKVANCNYESRTDWGKEIGFRYGSLVEDFFTGYRLQCEGWNAIFCLPEKPAFFGDAPITLIDILNQNKRWAVGLLEVAISKYSPLTFGKRSMGLLMGLGYAHYAWWPLWSISCTVYAFLPQLALWNQVAIFPKVSEPWFLLYSFLFLGAYIQDMLDFVLEGGTIQNWWNDQRMWMIRGITCFLFGFVEFSLKSFGISTGFNVTTKVLDDEQSKRYEQEIFDFGAASPMFIMLSMAAIINLFSLMWAIVELFSGGDLDRLFLHICFAGFIVVNCKPIYEGMFFRSDKGRMPMKTTAIATFLSLSLYQIASLFFKD